MNSKQHLDHLLKEWPFEAEGLGVRLVKGDDGRDVIQVRVDLGILQLETSGRPDGIQPEGHDSLLSMLLEKEQETPDFELDDETCCDIDAEFVQFYHRRMAWLRLQRFDLAVRDAEHTLALMDFCKEHSPYEEWTFQHEQHRAFVLFHLSQASALLAIERQQPKTAISEIESGLELIAENYEELGWDEQFENDELVERLRAMRESIRTDYEVAPTLAEQLAEAVELEQYELAAKLRDRIDSEQRNHHSASE
ncbi:MAG TPA: DNA helicase UvrBC [Planctomycetaceae bacterium]|nr:DNA helicase UvrBC [Planctomycetaceae bacterium]